VRCQPRELPRRTSSTLPNWRTIHWSTSSWDCDDPRGAPTRVALVCYRMRNPVHCARGTATTAALPVQSRPIGDCIPSLASNWMRPLMREFWTLFCPLYARSQCPHNSRMAKLSPSSCSLRKSFSPRHRPLPLPIRIPFQRQLLSPREHRNP